MKGKKKVHSSTVFWNCFLTEREREREREGEREIDYLLKSVKQQMIVISKLKELKINFYLYFSKIF